MKRGEIPDYYLQDPKYFEGYENEIRQLFGEGIVFDNRIAIHVRRGDYVDNPFYIDLTQENYYLTAVTYFPGAKFLVFSDDIDWCKKYFQLQDCEFSEGKTPEEDLKLMAGCKGIIIANSSLSWWAAFLGDKNKKVVYPKRWFTDGVDRVGFPKGWICL